MGNDYFRFKQFTIYQSAVAMKVGVDSVLLGAWVGVHGVSRILDVGTGTGLLALMLAQRVPGANIDAVEIDEDACRQARQNVLNSPWKEHIQVTCDDFRNFADQCTTRYDLIISNPPFFTASLKSVDEKRNVARHNDSLPPSDLLKGAKKLLASRGNLAVILPSVQGRLFAEEASAYGLSVKRILNIQSLPSKPSYRMLVELSNVNEELPVDEQTLCIENDGNTGFTDEYKNLTKDFYLFKTKE